MFKIQHCRIEGSRPNWYHLEFERTLDSACRRARQYALDNGGYVCVTDVTGKTVFGTDPAALNRAIVVGINKHFTQVSKDV